ncbi:hypothetical protein STRTUCAR8_04979 [Streptomyces turgidiscabies Car8]|uniref:Uncharacterized protein n=1 Tax=Streptomyces turgidiscabies (strain Car8) TaxID=698760 RepID=L7F4I0_STRT8|nr:hypothetical protein STRTUCAR8_04979 [Streptomyces turgidiscabies Car8]
MSTSYNSDKPMAISANAYPPDSMHVRCTDGHRSATATPHPY